MAASLGGLDAVAFTAGVGEHSAGVRRAVCARLGFLGVELDDDLNQGDPVDADVSTATSAVRVLVVAAREELIVARAVRGASWRGRDVRESHDSRSVRTLVRSSAEYVEPRQAAGSTRRDQVLTVWSP